jgi:hypothetical protein
LLKEISISRKYFAAPASFSLGFAAYALGLILPPFRLFKNASLVAAVALCRLILRWAIQPPSQWLDPFSTNC